ncbi:TRIM2 [Branchiostoma lanceolatum]|uniref:RING-type E3 ubiquitin transferase n=1 Tax=Branchiostoma lanceolatum TaxID=7740 RepID=A0A8J9Z5R6_BRALA|nr:TRIM2 [Branchiostoma lanceolatum]
MAEVRFPEDEFDEDSLTCPVCQELYKDPKLLPCLHTFCRKCLETWAAKQSAGRKFTCPLCRSPVELPCPVWSGGVDKLYSNFYINKLLDFRRLRQSKTSRVLCEMCKSGIQAAAVCGDCSFLLCNNCVKIHGHTPALKDHVIITLYDIDNATKRSKYTRQVYCKKHSQRTTFYCEPCETLVCRDCTVDDHCRDRDGENHDPRELNKVTPKCKDCIEDLMKKTEDAVITKINQQEENLDKGLKTLDKNYAEEKKKIKQHYAKLMSTLKLEEEQMIQKLKKVKKDRKNELIHRKEEMARDLKETREGLLFCQNVLVRNSDTELLFYWQQMEKRLQELASQDTGNATFGDFKAVSFHPCSLPRIWGSLSVFPWIDVKGPTVVGLPCSVTVTADNLDPTGEDVGPQVEVISPKGKTTLIETTATSPSVTSGKGQTSRVRSFSAKWRPQESGKHSLGVCMGGLKDLGSLTVDVGSNNPVLRFGRKGSQQGQFNRPTDIAVRGDRLYVPDTFNHRVQVFDLNGKFRYSFSTITSSGSIAVQIDGTIVVRSAMEVAKFSPSGKTLQKFPLDEYCIKPYGLAVQRDGRVVVTDPDKHSIFLFEEDGTLVKQVKGQGRGEGQFKEPCFVCVDNEDNITVSDRDRDCVLVFDKNIRFKNKFGEYGNQPQNMVYPLGVSADSRGNIVLANRGGQNIKHSEKLQVFRPNGTWVSTISSDGDKLNLPHGVAVTEDGHVFVADPGDHCIRKYRYM